MKTKFLSLFLLAGMLAACAEKDLDVNTPGANDGSGVNQFLTVSIVSAGNLGTRADEPKDPEYQDGSVEEDYVKSVRFFFFDNDNNEAVVKKADTGDGVQSYYDWTDGINGSKDTSENISRILTTTIVINSGNGDKIPASIVAVINPNNKVKELVNPKLAELNSCITTFMPTTEDGKQTNFTMSNSVYADNGAKMEAVSVDGHIYGTEEAAEANPVVIYVERINAKLTLKVDEDKLTPVTGITRGETELENVYSTGKNFDNRSDEPTATEDDVTTTPAYDDNIYVHFLGWNVTDVAQTSRLMKDINPAWPDAYFGTYTGTVTYEPWNNVNYRRSYWAINPTSMSYGNGNFGFGEDVGESDYPANKYTDFTGKTYAYLQENAAADNTDGSGPVTPTKVIIAAELIDSTGEPIDLTEWGGKLYKPADLLTTIANTLPFYKDQNGTHITDADLDFAPNNNTNGPKYPVIVVKKDADAIWYQLKVNDEGEDEYEACVNTDIASYLQTNVATIKYWKAGHTYYFFDVRHLGLNEVSAGYYGIVRNHIYEATLTSLIGLGTPVFDPNEPIEPEKPEEESLIAAQIRILSWRLVRHDVELTW